MTSERRAFLRVEADLAVMVARLDAAGEREPPITVRSSDISAGGVRLVAGHGCRVGDRLWLEVQFSQPHFLVFADAEVVRIDEDGSAGVRFDELETYTQQRVVRWVYAQDRRLFDRRAHARHLDRRAADHHRTAARGGRAGRDLDRVRRFAGAVPDRRSCGLGARRRRPTHLRTGLCRYQPGPAAKADRQVSGSRKASGVVRLDLMIDMRGSR